jgi:hypothetical protein
MLFQGRAKKVTILLVSNDANLSGPVCTALLAFLSPKDVCCLEVFDFTKNVEIRFMARPSKTDGLIQVIALIAPAALIQIDDTTIVHAQSGPTVETLTEKSADLEIQAPR